jgi:hypothetical protein
MDDFDRSLARMLLIIVAIAAVCWIVRLGLFVLSQMTG